MGCGSCGQKYRALHGGAQVSEPPPVQTLPKPNAAIRGVIRKAPPMAPTPVITPSTSKPETVPVPNVGEINPSTGQPMQWMKDGESPGEEKTDSPAEEKKE